MLIYNNGRFSLGSVSFKLPNGIGIDTGSDEICGYGFHLYAPDKSFSIQIDIKESQNTAHREIAHNFDGQFSYQLIGEIESISAGGLNGYKAFYEDKRTYNEEYAFDLVGCGNYTLLDIYVMIWKDAEYDEKYMKHIVDELLRSIERE